MNMKSKGKKILLLVCAVLIGIIILAFMSFKIVVFLLVENAKSDAEWQEDMRINGPDGEEAIWKSMEKDIYLICQFDESIDKNAATRIKVTAYILCNGQWITTWFGVMKGVETVEFGTNDGDIVLEGNVQLEDGKLIITNADDYGNEIIKNRTEIIIEKFSYEELIEELPFSIE